MHILITCPPMLRSIDRFKHRFEEAGANVTCPQIIQTLSEDSLVEILPQYDGWIIGDDPATRRVLQAGVAGRLKAAVKWGVGVDNVDLDGASALGIRIRNTPGMFGDEVADIAMAYIVTLARDLFRISSGVHQGNWPKPRGISLRDKVVALVGFGDIGKCTARRLLASHMRVNVYDPFATASSELDSLVTKHTWPANVEHADFIVLTCSLNPATTHMLDEKLLLRCKPGVRIVNVSRGQLIDEVALASSLESNKVHSAALEVFETEPLGVDSVLQKFDQCVFGSHNGSNTEEAVDRTSNLAIDLLLSELAIAGSTRHCL